MAAWWWRTGGVVAVAAVIGIVGVALTPSSGADRPPGPTEPTVATQIVELAPTTRPVRLLGISRASERGPLSFTQGGRVVERSVDVGDSVDAGQVLLRLDSAPLRHRVRQAQASLDDLQARAQQVQADRDRLATLRTSDSVSIAELQRIESQLRSLQANVQQATVGVDEARRLAREGVLRAPSAGVVSATMVEAGETVGAGQPAIEVTGSAIEVPVEAPERVWARLQGGESARVHLPGIDCVDDGARVRLVARSAGGAGGLFPVEVDLSDDCPVVAGLTAEVQVRVPAPRGVVVPVRSVFDPTGTQPSVFRVADGSVERVSVEPVDLRDGQVVVRGPLAVGDEVVTAGLVGLASGQRVQVRP